MKIQLKQQFQIESARFLPNLPPTHPCRRIHGHSFRITLTLIADENQLKSQEGWLIDYNEIVENMKPILNLIDHRLLNNVPGLENPTTENLCRWVYGLAQEKIPYLTQVSIKETSQTECSYPA